MMIKIQSLDYGPVGYALAEWPNSLGQLPARDAGYEMLGANAADAGAGKLCRAILDTLDRSDAVRIAYILRRWRGR